MDENLDLIKYDYHLHTLYSDGDHEIKEMVNVNIDEGIKKIAFTDHLDHYGYFLHTWHNKYPSDSIEDYIKRIRRIREKKKDKIEIYIGAEISTDVFYNKNPNNRRSDLLEMNIHNFSLFLIEGWYINNPISSALNLKQHLNNLGYENIPVIIAHPYFNSISPNVLKKLIDNDIGIELNNPKFSIIEEENFLKLISKIDKKDLSRLKISLGSDSHSIFEVGNISKVRNFIINHDLVENIVKLEM